MDEVLFVDKPAGMTSFGVVARLRRVLSQRSEGKRATGLADSLHDPHDEEKPSVIPHRRQRIKVGHTGTLDPFATGLMIIVTGKECRDAGMYTKMDKVYEATFVLGQTSTTGDPEGEIRKFESLKARKLESAAGEAQPPLEQSAARADSSARSEAVPEGAEPKLPSTTEVQAVLRRFTGGIKQRPPIFSAIKINGQRAYKLARDGKEVEIPERQVTVYSLELLDYSYPELKVRAHVSSGTYIRSLGVDIGEALGTGAYCSQLRRTRIADWDVADAKQLSDFGITS